MGKTSVVNGQTVKCKDSFFYTTVNGVRLYVEWVNSGTVIAERNWYATRNIRVCTIIGEHACSNTVLVDGVTWFSDISTTSLTRVLNAMKFGKAVA
jgi:hypothetical protein